MNIERNRKKERNLDIFSFEKTCYYTACGKETALILGKGMKIKR